MSETNTHWGGTPAAELGFRPLAGETWLTPDPTTSLLVTIQPSSGQVRQLEPQDWVNAATAPTVGPHVPIDIVRLFESARAALAYGAFSYPLFTLASEQLTRVCEAAAYERCGHLDPASTPKSFHKAVEHLVAAGVIEDEGWWTAVRHIRNIASHPRMQSLEMPGEALHFLGQVAQRITELFADLPVR